MTLDADHHEEDRVPALPEHVEFYWKRTGSWNWIDGTERWWEIFVRVEGFNGCGGYWVTEIWRWNGNPQNVREQVRNLSYTESAELTMQVRIANPGIFGLAE